MAGWTRVAKMTAAEERGMQAHCPRCGFTPRAPRTTCPLCARALVTDGPEGTDGRRSAAPLVVLGVGFVLATGGLLVANAIDTGTPPAGLGAGIPRLAPPDSGVLGTTESGGKRKKDRRDGQERRGELENRRGRDRDVAERDPRPSGDGDEKGEAERPDGVGDLASLPPLLPPIGSDEPDGAPTVPPLGDIPGMPPALTPVADIGGVSSGDDDSHDGHGDGDRGRDRDARNGGSSSVELDTFDRGESAYTVALARRSGQLQVSAAALSDAEEIAGLATVAFAMADSPIDVDVGVLDYGGDQIPYAGHFPFKDASERDEAETAADDLRGRIAALSDQLFPFDESLLCVLGTDADPSECDGKTPTGGGAKGREPAAAVGGDLPAPLGDVGDSTSDQVAPGDLEPQVQPEPENERPSAGEQSTPIEEAQP